MTSTTPFDLDGFLPYRLAVASARVSAGFQAIYGPRHGLNRAEWRLLAHLASADGPLSVREIFARVAMDKPKVSRAASRLELVGLVVKRADPRDRRLVALSLTRKGRAVVADLLPLAEAYQARLLARLGPEEAAALERALAVLGEEDGSAEPSVHGGTAE